MDLLRYEPFGVTNIRRGLPPEELRAAAGKLESLRAEVLQDLELWHSGQSVPPEKQPLDAGFIDLPERLLAEYRQQGPASEVGRIQQTANRLANEVDRMVVLGIGGSYSWARALFDSCCHSYHNELPRAARNGWPRIYFEGNNVDNDATQDLIDLVNHEHVSTGIDDSWGVVVISKSGTTLETAVAFRQFLSPLIYSCGHDEGHVSRRVVPVTGRSGKLFELAQALNCESIFDVPEGVGGRFSVLSAVGLLPAALMGLDIVALLEGAAAMNEHFRTAPPGGNAVLDYTAVGRLMEEQRGANIRVLSIWGKKPETIGLWYDQLLAESLGKQEQGPTPLTAVNTRDLHSRGQQHQEGRRDKLITNLIVEHPRREPLAVGPGHLVSDSLDAIANKALPEIMAAAIAGTNQAYREDERPTANLYLPRLDEASLGQLFQMLMLATVVEGRWMGINPYGQPGVEAYKKHMKAYLT